jgi:hypothetical protein
MGFFDGFSSRGKADSGGSQKPDSNTGSRPGKSPSAAEPIVRGGGRIDRPPARYARA